MLKARARRPDARRGRVRYNHIFSSNASIACWNPLRHDGRNEESRYLRVRRVAGLGRESGASYKRNRLVRAAGGLFPGLMRGSEAGVAALVVCALAGVAVVAVGCGNQYRPVITPINPTGPASLPSAYIAVASQPGFTPLGEGVTSSPCTSTTFSTPSIYTLIDFSGDSIVAQANGGQGPITFSLEQGGADVYAPNCDGTLTTAQATTSSLLTKYVLTSTLLPGSVPTNTLLANGNLYVAEAGLHGPTCLTTNCVAQMTGSPDALKQEIPVAPSLINLTGFSTGERIYAISQGNSSGGALTWGECATPSAVAVTGEADAIETTTNTVSARLPLGVCPVYGFMTQDTLRDFIMNRGSGTVTVINSQLERD